MGSGSGDTLVIVYVAHPKPASEIDEGERIPPLPRSPSVHDLNSEHFHDKNASMSNYELFRRRFLPEGQTNSKRTRKPKQILTADRLGHLS